MKFAFAILLACVAVAAAIAQQTVPFRNNIPVAPSGIPAVPLPDAVRAQGLSGLMDIALHPQFAQNRLVYLTYTKPLRGRRTRWPWHADASMARHSLTSAMCSWPALEPVAHRESRSAATARSS